MFSSDKFYVDLIHNNYGPDEFIISLVGPEIISLVSGMQYHGECQNEFSFNVSTPGAYKLLFIASRTLWSCN